MIFLLKNRARRLQWLAISLLRACGPSVLLANPSFNKPIYNPETKSYFELYSPDADDPKWRKNVRHFGAIMWHHGRRIASQRFHKGTRGRLAVVKTKQTHEFLRKNFQPTGAAWIGLRFWCRYRKLQWVTGDTHKRTQWQLWGPVWNLAGATPKKAKGKAGCARSAKHYLPVHYWAPTDGFFWNANGREKEFNQLFIEYPTGKE